jgi:pilus assembly protein CpaB
MLFRNVLLAIGVLCLVAGLGLAGLWLSQMQRASVEQKSPEVARASAVLAARRDIAAGTLLRAEDIGWKDVPPGEARPPYLPRGQVTEAEYLGAITRREFVAGEPLVAGDLVKPSDRQFLAAVLKPGMRAVSISVDAPQTASGLVRPGDSVDVILTQSFGESETNPGHKSVGETVLFDVRVIAVDQALSTPARPQPTTERIGIAGTEARVPKTVTLEVSQRQAETLFVAAQLGKLQLAVRPLEGSGRERAEEPRRSRPTWASDVSPALKDLSSRPSGPTTTGSSIEKSIRRPPVQSQ